MPTLDQTVPYKQLLQIKKKIYKSISPEDFRTTGLIDVDQFLIEAKPSSNQMPGGNNTTWD